jgi:hypothetical protein
MMPYIFNDNEKSITHEGSGKIIKPSCYDDLRAYTSYLLSRGHAKNINHVLDDVFKGEKIISKMIELNSKHNIKEVK